MSKEKGSLNQRILYGLVAGLVYALVLITIDHFFKESVEWNKIAIKAVVFGAIMTVIMNFRSKKKK